MNLDTSDLGVSYRQSSLCCTLVMNGRDLTKGCAIVVVVVVTDAVVVAVVAVPSKSFLVENSVTQFAIFETKECAESLIAL